MIKVTLKGESPQQIREEAKVVFGLVEPAVLTDAVDQPEDGARVTAAAQQAATPRRGRNNKKPDAPAPAPAAEAKAEEPKDELDPPAFLDRRDKPAEAKSDAPEVTLADIRGKLEQVLEKKGQAKMFEVVNAFQTADGKVAQKTSQFQPKDYPAVLDLCAKALAG